MNEQSVIINKELKINNNNLKEPKINNISNETINKNLEETINKSEEIIINEIINDVLEKTMNNSEQPKINNNISNEQSKTIKNLEEPKINNHVKTPEFLISKRVIRNPLTIKDNKSFLDSVTLSLHHKTIRKIILEQGSDIWGLLALLRPG